MLMLVEKLKKKQRKLPFKLTKREKQILNLALQLKNNSDIAKALDISKKNGGSASI